MAIERKDVLYIDGSIADLTYFVRVCRSEPTIHVTTTESIVKGIQLIGKVHFDLVLIDLKMPGMDGLALAKLILDEYPQLHGRLAIVTGTSPNPTKINSIQSDGLAILFKPLTTQVVKRALLPASTTSN
ncbi:response regulator [Litorivicinus lipolyticus]|uniref:response regulator n=1 Tax=Litorivicinus lipolyticus TaxID=418701 RepID=UPI003B5C6D36